MILIPQSTCDTCERPAQPTHMAGASSISSSISMVPASGEISPTTVRVDVMAECSKEISELKCVNDYSNQLILPEGIVYQNDLIKVWSIEEKQMADESTRPMTPIYEEPTINNDFVTLAQSKSIEETIPMIISFPPEEMEENFQEEEEDDLLLALSPSARSSLAPELPLLSPLSAANRSTQESDNIKRASNLLLLSPMASPEVGRSIRGSSNMRMAPNLLSAPLSPMPLPHVKHSIEESDNIKTVVIDDSPTSLDQFIPAKTTQSRGRRRGHRRNNSHFDFQFS